MRPLRVADAAEIETRLLGLVPDHVRAGWRDGSGDELVAAAARVLARVARSAASAFESGFILDASGPRRATGRITVTWTDGATEPVGLEVGQTVAALAWGWRVRLAEALHVPGGSPPGTTRTVAVESLARLEAADCRAGDPLSWSLPSGVAPDEAIAWTAASTPAGTAEFLAGVASGAVTVTLSEGLSGGSVGALHLLAAERGQPAELGERDDDLRRRIRTLPATVTPTAIRRAVDAVLSPYGVTCSLDEPWLFGAAIGRTAMGRAPVTRGCHFVVCFPHLPDAPPGAAVGRSATGRAPVGTADLPHAGLVGGIAAVIERIRAAGIWASTREAPVT